VTDQPEPGSVRIAELVATLSYASDLGLGQPMAHCMRQTVLALRLAGLAGASGRELEATQHGLMGTFEPAGLAAGAAGPPGRR
jgi:hypothetical protein